MWLLMLDLGSQDVRRPSWKLKRPPQAAARTNDSLASNQDLNDVLQVTDRTRRLMRSDFALLGLLDRRGPISSQCF